MITIYTDKRIKHKVQHLIKEHNSNDIYNICQSLNIPILKNDLGTVRGCLQYHENTDTYLIHINSNYEWEKFGIAHELGHYYLHKDLNSFKLQNCSIELEKKFEDQANIFAAELLLPDNLLNTSTYHLNKWKIQQIAFINDLPEFIVEQKAVQLRMFSQAPQNFQNVGKIIV
ncbi:ImmA/IrrE family metallo-endopeptidase [Bacillus zhangzhouensis]|nr:ImmA/IrrE family metallo-endopeptidase [Bacillus zhangzhouensis]